jgi:aminoglycoside 3-N-acetyltransferase
VPDLPRTRGSLAADLRQVGLAAGTTVMVHSSLSALGWVAGGSVAVVQALLDVVGPDGTLVVPTQTRDYSDPARWIAPPVPETWWPVIYEEMPAFDPAITPSRRMGVVAEPVRTWPGARRSSHPNVSFAALGRDADAITAGHQLDLGLGDGGPLGRLYERGAQVLLLGVGYDRCTALHLAQARLPGHPTEPAGAPLLEDGRRVWRWYREIDTDTEQFDAIGAAFEAAGQVRTGTVGKATACSFSLPAAVDFALEWLRGR